jgi:hypothetical protein
MLKYQVNMIEYALIVPLVAVVLTFGYAAYLDFRTNIIPFNTWFPMLIVSIPFSLYWYYQNYLYSPEVFFILTATVGLLCGIFFLISLFKLMGGADAMGLIFLTVCIPTFVFTPLIGNVGYGIFAVSVCINAIILGVVLIPLLQTVRNDEGEYSTGIPFMVPVFFGIVVSLVFGDLITMVLRIFHMG